MKRLLYIAAGLVAGYLVGQMGRTEMPKEIVVEVRDTVVMTDTLLVKEPVAVVTRLVRTDTVKLETVVERASVEPVIASVDSATVIIPIEQRTYESDDYRAWVSGYCPSLDSIEIYRQTDLVSVERTIDRRSDWRDRRWSLGLGVGYAVTARGLQPYVGVGVSYRLFRF